MRFLLTLAFVLIAPSAGWPKGAANGYPHTLDERGSEGLVVTEMEKWDRRKGSTGRARRTFSRALIL